jgi:three-Cys-motif partner protein
MSNPHTFGGSWTDEKLDTLRKYLEAYRSIFTKNPNARYFETTYVDAFAGTGSRVSARDIDPEAVPSDVDAQSYRQGSVSIALELASPFDHYFLIDKSPKHARELEQLAARYPERDILIAPGDANAVLRDWCANLNTRRNRAVVFLDPYGMQVEWQTIEAIASTRAIDMWLLFPLGQAVNRLLTTREPPSPAMAGRLTKTFGTDSWKTDFYKAPAQAGLFDTEPGLIKGVTTAGIAEFFLDRLRTIFPAVSPNYKSLRNSKRAVIYILCFAAANAKGGEPALRIANHLLKDKG